MLNKGLKLMEIWWSIASDNKLSLILYNYSTTKDQDYDQM